jgi:hypothetical protein
VKIKNPELRAGRLEWVFGAQRSRRFALVGVLDLMSVRGCGYRVRGYSARLKDLSRTGDTGKGLRGHSASRARVRLADCEQKYITYFWPVRIFLLTQRTKGTEEGEGLAGRGLVFPIGLFKVSIQLRIVE